MKNYRRSTVTSHFETKITLQNVWNKSNRTKSHCIMQYIRIMLDKKLFKQHSKSMSCLIALCFDRVFDLASLSTLLKYSCISWFTNCPAVRAQIYRLLYFINKGSTALKVKTWIQTPKKLFFYSCLFIIYEVLYAHERIIWFWLNLLHRTYLLILSFFKNFYISKYAISCNMFKDFFFFNRLKQLLKCSLMAPTYQFGRT